MERTSKFFLSRFKLCFSFKFSCLLLAINIKAYLYIPCGLTYWNANIFPTDRHSHPFPFAALQSKNQFGSSSYWIFIINLRKGEVSVRNHTIVAVPYTSAMATDSSFWCRWHPPPLFHRVSGTTQSRRVININNCHYSYSFIRSWSPWQTRTCQNLARKVLLRGLQWGPLERGLLVRRRGDVRGGTGLDATALYEDLSKWVAFLLERNCQKEKTYHLANASLRTRIPTGRSGRVGGGKGEETPPMSTLTSCCELRHKCHEYIRLVIPGSFCTAYMNDTT